MRFGPYPVARVGNVRTVGDRANRRRLRNDRDNHDDDNDAEPRGLDATVLRVVALDLVGVVERVEYHDERLRIGNEHDHDHDLDDDNNARPVRPCARDDDDHNDDLDDNHDARAVRADLPANLRNNRRRLHDDGVRAREPRPAGRGLHNDDLDHDDDL